MLRRHAQTFVHRFPLVKPHTSAAKRVFSVSNAHSPTLNIGIIGSGTAGCASALFLSRLGHKITLLERTATPGPVVGAGILLQPTGMYVLSQLGLLDEVYAHSTPIHNLHCQTRDGRTIFNVHYKHLHEKLFGLGIHRGALFHSLFSKLSDGSANERVTIVCDAFIDTIVEDTSVTNQPPKVILRQQQQSNGSGDVSANGQRDFGPFDLVIIADGARSTLRKNYAPLQQLCTKSQRYPWGAVWFVGKHNAEKPSSTLRQTVHGTTQMLGVLPSGSLHADAQMPLASMFWSLHSRDYDQFRAGNLEEWKQQVTQFAPHAASLIAQIDSVDKLTFADYYDVILKRPYTANMNVLCIGDAAHATSPQLGQGSNHALMDALTLHEAFVKHSAHQSLAVGELLNRVMREYHAERSAPLRFYGITSRMLTPVFQSHSRTVGLARDTLFDPLSKLPFANDQMARVLSGVKRGFLKRSLPIEPLADVLQSVANRHNRTSTTNAASAIHTESLGTQTA